MNSPIAATESSAAGVTTFTADGGTWNATIDETTGAYVFTQTAAYDHTGLPGGDTGAISVTRATFSRAVRLGIRL